MTDKKESESVLRVRIDDSLRKAFIDTCKDNDLTASQVIRKFVKGYVAAEGQTKMFK